MRNTGQMAGIYESLQALVDAGAKNNQRVEIVTGERYSTSTTDLGSGVALSTGNFANLVSATKESLGLGNVDNTSDLDKPVSTATQTALAGNTITKVLPQTVSGTLTVGGQINQLRDSGSFTLHLANSVDADTIVVVELPDTYNTQTPTLTAAGSDLIRDGSGTDTSITWAGAARLTLTSDGVSKWEL